jgi:anti-sigma regulatory factor (Ser/Thr protein kinase)
MRDPLTVPGNLDSLSLIGTYVLDVAEAAGLDKKSAYRLRLAVDEIATNIVLYGYQGAGIEGLIELHSTIDEQALTLTVEDTGPPFDPRSRPAPDDLDLPLEERDMGGLGIHLAITGVDQFVYERVGRRNRNVFIVSRS